MDPPPPPPPHGGNQQNGRSGGLPPGNYDIFVIPPHSSGSGFLYLPSLHTHRNSFLAGVACTASAFLIWSVVVPVIKEWFNSLMAGGGPGVLVLMISVGVGAWAFGKTQAEGSSHSGGGQGAGGTGASGSGRNPQSGSTQVPPNASAGAAPKSSWQRPNATSTGASGTAKNSWEKAREETRKKEEERKKAEEARTRREEAERERQKQREKDAKEREERERKQQADKAERGKRESEAAGGKAKDKAAPKRPPHPTARTETEDDAYSFRPYDRPKQPVPKAGSTASTYSESSYAASQTTARTTPPPSHRGPYSTKDPDKIIIKAVYSFNNAFQRTPVAQLISGQGSVTDGLILRITTEGLFIDDDIRGVPQREWDVKAWTMKMAEVWCPNFIEGSTSLPGGQRLCSFVSPNRVRGAASRQSPTDEQSNKNLKQLSEACIRHCKGVVRRTDVSSVPDSPNGLFHPPCCHASGRSSSTTKTQSSAITDDTLKQSGELSGLHVLRASIRDQEGKKYVFILAQTEGWKVAVGLQRLRRGTQVRALGVSGMPPNETKALIEILGWG